MYLIVLNYITIVMNKYQIDLKKHYPKDWIVLQNKVLECFRGMSLDEKRLLILATPLARTTNVSASESIFISAEEFATACGIDKSTAYTALEAASDKIFNRFFSYVSDDNKRVKVRWTYKTEYGDGGSDIYFTDDVLLMLRTFDELNPYTKYKKEIVLKLKLDYSLDLYHLAKKHQKMTEFSMTLEDLFEQLGLPESYKDLSNLKRVFLHPTIKEINKQTEIELDYENLKKGKKVIGFKFFVKEKPKATKIIEIQDEVFPKLSEAQISKYSSMLSKDATLSKLSNFSDYNSFAFWLAGILRDPKSVKEATAKKVFKALRENTDFRK